MHNLLFVSERVVMAKIQQKPCFCFSKLNEAQLANQDQCCCCYVIYVMIGSKPSGGPCRYLHAGVFAVQLHEGKGKVIYKTCLVDHGVQKKHAMAWISSATLATIPIMVDHGDLNVTAQRYGIRLRQISFWKCGTNKRRPFCSHETCVYSMYFFNNIRLTESINVKSPPHP